MVLAGLAYQYATDKSQPGAVLVCDTLAERAIADVLAAMEGAAETDVVE